MKLRQKYWVIIVAGKLSVKQQYWLDSPIDKLFYKTHNFFRTKKNALFALSLIRPIFSNLGDRV